jgi:hypothetical protein
MDVATHDKGPHSHELLGCHVVSVLQSTKSPGSRSSVVSIGSVCGAAGPGAAFTPQAAGQRGSQELEAGKYTPTMKLECLFDSTRAYT